MQEGEGVEAPIVLKTNCHFCEDTGQVGDHQSKLSAAPQIGGRHNVK